MSCLSFPATSTTAISTLSLHDALPISTGRRKHCHRHYDRDHVRGSGGDRRIPERVHRDLYDVDRRGFDGRSSDDTRLVTFHEPAIVTDGASPQPRYQMRKR